MRITQAMMNQETIRTINERYTDMIQKHSQAISGEKRVNPSDDPRGAGTSLYLSARAGRLEQYSTNVEAARSVVSGTESALSDINECVQGIQELVSQGASSTLSQSQREAICIEINQYRDQIVASLNSTGATGYILGGYNTKTQPMTQTGDVVSYNGLALDTITDAQAEQMKSQTVTYTLGEGISMKAGITALDITGTGADNLFATIDNITAQLSSADPDEDVLTAQQELLEGHYDRVLSCLTQTGGREKRLDIIGDRLTSMTQSVEDLISANDDMDYEEAIIRYTTAQQAYDAALNVSGTMLQTSLLDYLE